MAGSSRIFGDGVAYLHDRTLPPRDAGGNGPS
jgi:hypothetical protein